MSVKIQFSSLSLGASVDQQTGTLSVFDILEEIRVPQLPIHLQSLVISIIIEKSDAPEFNGKMLIHLLTPDGKQVSLGNGELKIHAEQRKMKAVFRFGGFPVMQFGRHRFVLSCLNASGTKVAESLLDFDTLQAEAAPQVVPTGDRGPLAH